MIERIAVGGMAEVFKAKSRSLGGFEKTLAIKRLHAKFCEDQEFIKMLIEEARISVQLNHINIGQIFDLEKIGDSYFICMEYIDGPDLAKITKKCDEFGYLMPIEAAAFIAMDVCHGLDYAHRKKNDRGQPLQIVHRDVSPQNILISYEGEVKLVDFGIAKAAQRDFDTGIGVIKGKFYYMSPEQAQGESVDHRTDIFSCGIVLYEMLTGTLMYRSDDDASLLSRVRKARFDPPRAVRGDIPRDLEQIVLRALARSPERRYTNALEMGSALQAFLFSIGSQYNKARLGRFIREFFGREDGAPPPPDGSQQPMTRDEVPPSPSSLLQQEPPPVARGREGPWQPLLAGGGAWPATRPAGGAMGSSRPAGLAETAASGAGQPSLTPRDPWPAAAPRMPPAPGPALPARGAIPPPVQPGPALPDEEAPITSRWPPRSGAPAPLPPPSSRQGGPAPGPWTEEAERSLRSVAEVARPSSGNVGSGGAAQLPALAGWPARVGSPAQPVFRDEGSVGPRSPWPGGAPAQIPPQPEPPPQPEEDDDETTVYLGKEEAPQLPAGSVPYALGSAGLAGRASVEPVELHPLAPAASDEDRTIPLVGPGGGFEERPTQPLDTPHWPPADGTRAPRQAIPVQGGPISSRQPQILSAQIASSSSTGVLQHVLYVPTLRNIFTFLAILGGILTTGWLISFCGFSVFSNRLPSGLTQASTWTEPQWPIRREADVAPAEPTSKLPAQPATGATAPTEERPSAARPTAREVQPRVVRTTRPDEAPQPAVQPTRERASVLEIATRPFGAQVVVNGQLMTGLTPLNLKLDPGKSHQLRVELEGYQGWSGAVTLQQGEHQQLLLELHELTGLLEVRSTPTGAEVLLDNLPVGVTPLALDNLSISESPLLVLRYPGYEDQRTQLVWRGRTRISLDLILTPVKAARPVERPRPVPAPPPPAPAPSPMVSSPRPAPPITAPPITAPPTATSYLTVYSLPMGRVLFNGRDLGAETPMVRRPVPAGVHQVQVYFPSLGRSSESRTLRLQPDRELKTLFDGGS